MSEIWLPVVGYEGLYEVSNFGRVRSLGNGESNNSKMRVLSPVESSIGYLQVGLSKNGKEKKFKVHRLVAEAFIPNLFNEPCINHRDENKLNNHVDNLEWCDRKYNCNFGTRNKRIAQKLSKPVIQFSKTGELVREWPSTMEAGRNGFQHSSIAKCCRGELKSHGGYIWRYK